MRPNIVQIPLAEVDFHPASFVDHNARLFWWKGQLYRAIRQNRKALYTKLFQEGVIQSLIDKGLLINTELTNLSLDGYDMVLKHERIEFISYPYEWCAEMLKDAALLIADLQIDLSLHGLSLQDGHPLNVLYDGCRPVFVDFGSIVPEDDKSQWIAFDEFRRFVINPLQLMAHGQGRIARWMLHDMDKGILDSEVEALTSGVFNRLAFDSSRGLISVLKRRTPQYLRPTLKKQLIRLKSFVKRQLPRNHQSSLEFSQQVRKQIERIHIPSRQTNWTGYHESEWFPFSPSDEWTQKHRTVYEILSDIRPSSVLDVACNEGWYSQLAAVLGSRVVAFDIDETTITNLYRRNRTMNLPILALVMDLRTPSPGYGLCNLSFPPAIQRFGCEMVFALALIHHLVFKQYFNFKQIVDTLCAFSKKWLLVEFIPPEDQFVRNWSPEEFPWYSLDNFIEAIKTQFHIVRILPSFPEPRVLLLCEK